jgi:hypothetical protein
MVKKKSIREQIKEMEVKSRQQAIEAAPAPAKPKEPAAISFDQWWMVASKKLKLKPWLKEVIAADFKARGLSKDEKEESYNQALEKFGYKLPK